MRMLADIRESLLRGAQQHHIGGHARRRQVVGDAHGHGGIGLRRESVALPLDRGGQRLFQGARSQLGHHRPRLGEVLPRSGPDELDVSFGRRGVGFQLRLDGLGERDDAGETLGERVVDFTRQPFAFGGGARLTGQASALGAGGRQLGDQHGQLSALPHRGADHGADHRHGDHTDEGNGNGHRQIRRSDALTEQQ